MKKLFSVCIAVAALFAVGCGDNWLDNAPAAYMTKIAIAGDGTGTIEGVAQGQIHAVYVGTNTFSQSSLRKATGTSSWTFTVSGLKQGPNTVYICAASGSAYGTLRSWSFNLESEGYEKVFENVPVSSAGASSVAGASSSSANTDTDENYDFNGNIATLRDAITSTTAQTVNVTVTGVVHACKSPGLFWIQDNTAGIYVYTKNTDNPAIGDKITLTATTGQVYLNLKEVTAYTGYSVVSTGNLVYRQTGTPTAEKQGQAWKVASAVVASAWADKSNITIGGVSYRNDSGLIIAAGTYRLQGPVSQYNADIQVMVFPGGAVDLNPPASSSSASSTSAGTSTSGTSSAASANPSGTWAADAAKPANQRPFNNYYADAYGKTGTALKTALVTIISSGYVTKSYDYLYTTYSASDRTSDGKVWDVYSDRDGTGLSRPYTYSYGSGTCGNYSSEGDCYNREHGIPQSKFGKASPMVSDAHHILPTDGKVNGMRSDWPHTMVGSASWTSQNGSKLGNSTSSGYSGTGFEPINAYKGDIARLYLYFSIRYYGNSSCGAWTAMSSGAKLLSWAQTQYRAWHAADPVSPKEVTRNQAIYEVQHNRNPFIDYPELADLVDFTK